MTFPVGITPVNDDDQGRIVFAKDAFESARQSGRLSRIEDFLPFVTESLRTHLLAELLRSEIQARRAAGEQIAVDDYATRFPDHVELVSDILQSASEASLSSTGKAAVSDPMVESARDVQTILLVRSNDRSEVSDCGDGKWVGEVPEQFGRYQIERELGRGGMGAVFLAHDRQLDRRVALKIPLFKDRDDVDAIERFYREARAMATVQHANLCPVFDVGQFEQWHYLTMAFIDGDTLTQKLHTDGIFTVEAAATMLRKVALAVQKAHDAGIVHRDLKPANIMVTRDHEPIIMDFGLARRQKTGEIELTQSGAVFGSPAYMAPEQVEARHKEIGPATDVYALGIILFQMVTGHRPFEGRTAASIFGQIVSRPADPPSKLRSDLPAELDKVCLKAISKSPTDRHQSATEFAADLVRVSSNFTKMTTTPSVDPADARRATIGGQFSNQYGDEPSNSRVRREAELRQVTVAIFNYENEDSSLTDSSVSHSETLHEQAQSFERFVGDRVAQFGGATVSSTGHEVIACFGFPQAFEDAPQRAIRTALHLQRDLAEARTRTSYLPAPEQTWATIHSGEAVAELLGSAVGASISVVGDARNVAARLNAVAQPGTVIISPATHQRVRLYFECESLGAQRVRGAAQPVELFKVIKEAASRNRVELVDPGNLTPLIGRDTELTILKDRWEQALEELGQVVLLIGDAGLGKSRLIRELREHVMRVSDDDVAIIELRCSQYHQNTSFFPIVEYLSRLLVLEDHSPSDRLELAVGYLRELSLDSAEQVAFFCGVLDIPTDSRFPPLAISPQKLKEQTEEFLLRWLQRLATARPVLFIVEDLHWVDPSTIELLNKHITQFESGRMLSILTFRPEFETPWKSKPHQTQIALNRLTKRQIAEMMRKRTHRQTIPEPILQRIIDRTDGIPLFIEEFTNVIVESGVLDHESIDDSSLLKVIPATLHDLLLARLDRLEADREVIQLAATIGREFSFELLAASATIPEGDLKNELDKLVKAEILFQKGQGASASYIFKHALLQDAAYRSMLTKKRQQFHHRLAAVLETKFSSTVESMPALLAQHFTEAAVTPKAIEYWLKAGQRSQSRSANLEAISQLQKGLGLVLTLQDGPERLGLELQYRLSLTAPLLAVKGYASPEAQEQNNRARELCEIIGPGSPLFPVMMVIWSIQFIRGRLDETLGIATELRGLAEAANDKGPLTEAWWVSGCNAWWTGDFIGGRDYLQKIFESDWYDAQVATGYSQFTQQNSGPLSLAYWALSLWALGYADQARAKMKEALALNEKLKHPYTTAVTYWKSALMWQLALVGPMTEEWSDKVIKVSREQTFVFWEGLGTGNKGAALTLQGRHDEAIRLLEQGIAMVKSTGAELTVQNYWACLADALWKSGHRDDAWRALNEAFALKDRDSERFIEAELYRRRGDFFAEQSPDNTADAEAAYLKSIEVARNQQAKFFEIRSTTRLCRLWQRQGRTNDARQLLSPVYDWFTEGFDMPDLIAAKALLAELS